MIDIDASQGEGGGQVLRSSLTLSMLTGQPIHLKNVRARRSKPGLQAQHLQAVKAATEICNANVEGATLGSQTLHFEPSTIKAGKYHFEIGTAGATSLVLQTIFIPLSLTNKKSTVTIGGGTHVSWSPCFHYLEWQWLAFMRRLGYDADFILEQAGFYPQGGGKIQVAIRPRKNQHTLSISERGALINIRGLSGVAKLSKDIARRQKLQALRQIEMLCRDSKIKTEDLPSPNKGTFIALLARFEHSQACYTALGAPGKRAERVADEAVSQLQAFLAGDGSVDQYLADQLILPLSIAEKTSHFTTFQVTEHLLTNAKIVQKFCQAKISIEGKMGKIGYITIAP